MKTLPPALAAHFAQECQTIAHCLRIDRADGQTYGLTSAPDNLVVSGVTYLANPGLMVANLSASAGLAVDNTEVTFLPDEVLLRRVDFMAGRWNAARFELFEVNYANVGQGINLIKKGVLGDFRPDRNGFVAELRGLSQFLQQPIGEVTTKTCKAVLGDNRCKVNVAALSVTTAVTAVASRYAFTVSGIAGNYADDWFKEGTARWVTGENAGLSVKIKTSSAAGVITLSLPAFFAMQAGDVVDLFPGCQKRLIEDCRDKYNNVLNFRGQPHLQGMDSITKPPERTE